MKHFIVILFTFILFLSYQPKAYSESIGLRVCEYIAVNDKNRLRKYLKSKKIKLRTIFKSIKCNNKNLLVFAASKGSIDVGELIINKIPKKEVKNSESAVVVLSPHLETVIRNRLK